MTTPNEVAGLIERAVMVCPQCEGEGSYADGLDEAACSTDCTRCGTNGWIVDLASLSPTEATEPLIERVAEWPKPRPNYSTKATFDQLIQWLSDVNEGRWSWTRNSKCKYVDIRIDTRSGAYALKDRDGNELQFDEVSTAAPRAALSSSISNAEPEDSGEVVQADIDWAESIAQHLCHPADRPAAIRLVSKAFRDHRLAARQSPDSLVDDQIKHMVNRFLQWKLPKHFCPDAGIKFEPEFNVEWNAKQGLPPQRHEPSGTNLFGYDQAEEMVRHMLKGVPGWDTALASLSKSPSDGEGE